MATTAPQQEQAARWGEFARSATVRAGVSKALSSLHFSEARSVWELLSTKKVKSDLPTVRGAEAMSASIPILSQETPVIRVHF